MRWVVASTEQITVHCARINDWTVLEIDGEVDLHTHTMVRRAVTWLLPEGHRHFVLDLRSVPFLDSTGLGTMVTITKRIQQHGGSLRIVCPSTRILRTFQTGGLGDAYEFYDTIQEATRRAPTADGLAHWPGPVR